jgi:hypothetical protein
MNKQNFKYEDEIPKKAKRREMKKSRKMGVSGAGVKKLQKLIKEKKSK